jgi:uncharacterized protein
MNSENSGLSLEEIRRIVGPVAEEYGMKKVFLFGSRARGDCRPDSDYDFLVVAPEDCTLFTLGGFYTDLREAIGSEIDVVTEGGLHEDFAENIENDLIPVYGE